jgi:hypothetical protein
MLQPIQRLPQLVHLVGYFSLSNPGGCLTNTSFSNTPSKKELFTSIWYNLNPLAMEKARRIRIASKRAMGAKVSS